MNRRRPFFAVLAATLFGLGLCRAGIAAGEQYLLFTCHLHDASVGGEVLPGTVELFTDITKDPKLLRSDAAKPGLFTVDVLKEGKLLTKIAIPAVLHSIPVAETSPLTRAEGKLVADVEAPYGGQTRHPVQFEVDTDGRGNPVRAFETDLKNGEKMQFSCEWAPMIQ